MFILALLDVSPCMGQQTQLGLTLLECAKTAVEQLLDSRRREGVAQRDQYMLVTTADTPLQPLSHSDSHTQVVCGWHDNARFLSALKAVQPLPPHPPDTPASPPPSSTTYLATAITASLDLLNRYSRPNGIDNFGRGRIFHYNEPAILLLLTTDQRPPQSMDYKPAFAFVPSSLAASAFASAPYRWDQRLFPVVLRLGLREKGGVLQSASSMAVGASSSAGMRDAAAAAAAKSGSVVAPASSPLSVYLSSAAEQTGGKCVVATSFASLLSHVDGLSKRPCPNVFIHLTPHSSSTAPPASPRSPSPTDPTAPGSVWRYRSEFVGVYVKSVGVWPCPETYLADPVMQTLPPREPHPTFYFSHKPKPLLSLLLDSATTATATATAATPGAGPSAAPSIAVSSAPPPLPPLESSIPADSYTLDPSAPICSLLFADEADTCRYVTAHPLPSASAPPFGLLYANKAAKKAYLVVLPYDFPTFFSYLARIDTHLRSLPLTSSSSAALTSNPALYAAFAAHLSTLPFYYWPAVQSALGKVHRLPRLDVRMDVGVVGGLGVEVGERMRRWKEEAGREMKEEKEVRDKDGKPAKKDQPDGEQTEGRKKKRRREHVGNGETAASAATAEQQQDTRLRRRPLSPAEAEVEWLLAPNSVEERSLLPPPPPPHSSHEAKEDRKPWRQRGRVAVVDLFGLRDEDVDAAMSEWRDRARQLLQPYPLLASLLPPPPAPPPSTSSSPTQLTLRPRLPSSTTEPSHPIAAMGDFHTYLRSLPPPLRPVDSGSDDEAGGGGGLSAVAFGSPYRRHGRRGVGGVGGVGGVVDVEDVDHDVDVNERDVAVVGSELQQTRERGKWKLKPSLREFVARKEKVEDDEWMQHR